MTPSKTQIAEAIKQARNHKSKLIGKKYTQEDLANDLGISRSYIGDFESGRRYPNIVLLGKIGNICDVPLKDMFDEKDYDNDQATITKADISEIIEKIAKEAIGQLKFYLQIENDQIFLTEDEAIALKLFLQKYRNMKKEELNSAKEKD